MSNYNSSKQVLLSVVGIAILIVAAVGVVYAFFNYTRTGTANVIRTGRINFNSTQGAAINLSNMFPINVTGGIPNDATKVGSVTINVTGDTTYTDGIEYLVSAVNVSNTVGSGANAKQLPISIDVSVASNTTNDPATTLGTADSDYFTNRGASANTSIYKVLASDVIANNDQLVVGYIKSGATGVDGNIVIRAYLDASKIAISDTYPERTVHTVKTTGYSSNDCETVLTGVQDASTYCATASDLQDAIDNEDLTSAQISLLVNAGIVDEYTDGTTSTWVGERTVFTTQEWNSLQTNGVSFQVKIEANEGIWVPNPGSANMSLSSSSGNITEGESTQVTITPNDNGTLTCHSSDTTKATCTITGTTLTINGLSAGSATITVTQTAGSNYATASTATYAANVMTPFRGTATQLANSASTYGLETTPYGKVYSGAIVNNYIKFNCDGTICEEWRILGVYGDKLKIVKGTPIVGEKYNNSNTNVWEGSRLETYLNQDTDGGYYYSLNTDAKAMIADGSWDVGACGYDIAAEAAYTCATTTNTYDNVTYTTPLTNKKVGLIATYEYLYAAENDGTCWTTLGNYENFDTSCAAKDWLYPTLTRNGQLRAWTFSPSNVSSFYAILFHNTGYVTINSPTLSLAASPVVYLKSGVTITGGNGQSGNGAYTLSYSGS